MFTEACNGQRQHVREFRLKRSSDRRIKTLHTSLFRTPELMKWILYLIKSATSSKRLNNWSEITIVTAGNERAVSDFLSNWLGQRHIVVTSFCYHYLHCGSNTNPIRSTIIFWPFFSRYEPVTFLKLLSIILLGALACSNQSHCSDIVSAGLIHSIHWLAMTSYDS